METSASTSQERDVQIIADLIRQKRNQLGWTQFELAERAGITHSYVKKIELAKSVPSAITIARIAKALREPVDHFLQHIEIAEDEITRELEQRMKKSRMKPSAMAVGNLDFKAKKQLLKILREMAVGTRGRRR